MIIDVYADVVCPWCYVGAARLEQALAQRPDLQVERRWQPFQLRPEMPPQGEPWREFAVEKFGGEGRMAAAFDQVARAGAADGLTFRFDRVASAPNTVDAHRLIQFAGDKQWQMAHALFRGYFAEGRNLNDHEQLAQLAVEAGLHADAARNFLLSAAGKAEIERSQAIAYRHGVNSVPHYIIDGKYALVGAQPAEVWLQALDYVMAEGQRARGETIALHT